MLFCAVGVLAVAPFAQAQSADPADIADGMRLFRQKADCQSCHGWAGDGRKMDSQSPDGANLRETGLDRATLILTIKCGRPGTGMPPFDKFAYSDGRCFGLKQADLKARQLSMADPPSTLAAGRDRAHRRFPVCEGHRQGPDGPRQVRRVLGLRRRRLQRIPEVTVPE